MQGQKREKHNARLYTEREMITLRLFPAPHPTVDDVTRKATHSSITFSEGGKTKKKKKARWRKLKKLDLEKNVYLPINGGIFFSQQLMGGEGA